MYFLFLRFCVSIRISKGNKNLNTIKESGGTDYEKVFFWEAVQPADRLLQVVLHGLLTGIPKQTEGGIDDEEAGWVPVGVLWDFLPLRLPSPIFVWSIRHQSQRPDSGNAVRAHLFVGGLSLCELLSVLYFCERLLKNRRKYFLLASAPDLWYKWGSNICNTV